MAIHCRQCIDFLVCRRDDMEPLVAMRLLPKGGYAQRGLAPYDMIGVVLRDVGLPKLTLVEKKSYDPETLKKKLKIAMVENQPRDAAPDSGSGGDGTRTGAHS